MSALDLVKHRRRSMSLRGLAGDVWAVACELLGIELQRSAAVAKGTIGGHAVSVGLVGHGNDLRTEFRIALETPHAPRFSASPADGNPQVDGLIDLSFEGLVSVTADDADAMQQFLTPERRQLIQEVIQRWSDALITDTEAVVSVPGIATDAAEMVASTMKLVSLASSISPCWADMALDEGSVLDDLFNGNRSTHQIEDRFDRLYRGSEITWTGEILQLGAVEGQGRLALILLGSSPAQGQAGTMWLHRLDGNRRMFKIDTVDSWKPQARSL